MSTSTVTSKGQITIPASVRKALQLDAGDRVEFIEVEPGIFQFLAVTHDVRELKGLLKDGSAPISLDQMQADIAEHGGQAS